MKSEFSPEKEILFSALRSCLPGLRNATDSEIESALNSKSTQQDAELFVRLVKTNLSLEYDDDYPQTKIVLIFAGAEQLGYIKKRLHNLTLPVKINAKALVNNLDYLENWYDEQYPYGYTKVFNNFVRPTVCD
jgi:hypothetical protein